MITVIIPVYNGEKYFDQCLTSISGAQILVVNDASTDTSRQIAARYTTNIIDTDHKGPVYARNVGILHTNSEYLMFMDADDYLVENALKILDESIDDNDIVIGLRQDFVSPDCTWLTVPEKKSSHGVISGCALIRQDAFDRVGLFDQELMCGDGYDWLLRAEKMGLKIKKIDTVLCMRRIHDTNMGRTLKDQEYKDYCKIIRKHFGKK